MSNKSDLNNWTKTDMARVILQALHNTNDPFPAEHFKVTRLVKRFNKVQLVHSLELALMTLTTTE
jgi:hypothetical protein